MTLSIVTELALEFLQKACALNFSKTVMHSYQCACHITDILTGGSVWLTDIWHSPSRSHLMIFTACTRRKDKGHRLEFHVPNADMLIDDDLFFQRYIAPNLPAMVNQIAAAVSMESEGGAGSGVVPPAHSPGPWRYAPNAMGHILWIVASDGTLIAEVSARREPDARLIAAAPKLLDALAALVKATEEADNPGDAGVFSCSDVMGDARAALAKAKSTPTLPVSSGASSPKEKDEEEDFSPT